MVGYDNRVVARIGQMRCLAPRLNSEMLMLLKDDDSRHGGEESDCMIDTDIRSIADATENVLQLTCARTYTVYSQSILAN